MEAVTRLEWLGLARMLRVVAVVVEARLARCARCLWLGSHDAREVQLELRNNYYISTTPQTLFIYMAAAPSAAGGNN